MSAAVLPDLRRDMVLRACAAARELCDIDYEYDLLPRPTKTPDELLIIRARWVAMWLLMQTVHMSTMHIAHFFDRMHHSSILYGRNKIAREIADDATFRTRLDAVAQKHGVGPNIFSRRMKEPSYAG